MTLPSIRHSLRTRLLAASLLVEILMLVLLVGNSVRLIQEHLIRQTERRITAIELAYKTAVAVPLASRDYATLRDILDGWRQADDILYMAITDPKGQVLSASGWDAEHTLPVASEQIELGSTLHVVVPVEVLGQRYGAIHYGMDLGFLQAARRDLFVQSSLIALLEITASLILLSAIAYWITRHLIALAHASERIAAGDFSEPVAIQSQDEVGLLAHNFNEMAEAVSARVAALQAAEARQRALLLGLGEGVYGVDPAGNCTFINPAALQLLGYEEAQVLGADQHALFHHSHADGSAYPAVLCPIAQTLKDGVPRRLEELFFHASGTPIPVWLSVTPLLAEGQVTGAIVVFMDLREQKQIQDDLRRAKEAAEEASQAKSRFLANMSHELRTPMNGISGMAQLLQMDGAMDERERKDCARVIQHSCESLVALVTDILDMSKIEAGRMELSRECFDPNLMLQELAQLFAQTAKNKGLSLESAWLGSAGEQYWADAGRVRQMVTNLLNNAIKFTAQGRVAVQGRVLEQTSQQAVLEFSVLDTGIGVEQDKLDRLFQPFSQVDGSSTRQYGGTGLGLSIVRSLAEMMGGTVGVETTPGQGSRFWFRIQVGNTTA